MTLVGEKNINARRFLADEFAASFPRSFRCLQDMAVAGANAYKNNGKRAWFGFGRDLSIESMRKFQDSVATLVMTMGQEDFLNLPAARGMPEEQQINHVVSLFFVAYPNWQDAEASWAVVGQDIVAKYTHCNANRRPANPYGHWIGVFQLYFAVSIGLMLAGSALKRD